MIEEKNRWVSSGDEKCYPIFAELIICKLDLVEFFTNILTDWISKCGISCSIRDVDFQIFFLLINIIYKYRPSNLT